MVSEGAHDSMRGSVQSFVKVKEEAAYMRLVVSMIWMISNPPPHRLLLLGMQRW